MTALVHDLTANDRDRLLRHFRQLDAADRRLRFGYDIHPDTLRDYVERIDFNRDAVFGVFDADFELRAVAHLGLAGATAELGLSVLPAARREGLGLALLNRVVRRARTLRHRVLWTHCLRENESMMKVARKAGMRIVIDSGEADAYLELPPATPLSFGLDLLEAQISLSVWALHELAGHPDHDEAA